jgi:hypothetical protein
MEGMMMPLDFNAVRQRYPNPVRVQDREVAESPQCYCVGGAVCLSALDEGLLGMIAPDIDDPHFPDVEDLAMVFLAFNPALATEDLETEIAEADVYAEAVTEANDAGDFDGAWALVAEALAYKAKNIR